MQRPDRETGTPPWINDETGDLVCPDCQCVTFSIVGFGGGYGRRDYAERECTNCGRNYRVAE